MTEAPPGKQGRQIGRHVGVGVAQITAVEHHGPVKQGIPGFPHRFELGEQIRQQLHVPLVNRLELPELLIRFPVVRQTMIGIRHFFTVHVDHR